MLERDRWTDRHSALPACNQSNVYSCAFVAAAKEQNKHDHVDQSTAFLAAARHKPAFGVSDLEPKFKVNGSHVPGCGGGCTVAANGGGGCGTIFDAPSSGLLLHRNTAGLKKVLNSVCFLLILFTVHFF